MPAKDTLEGQANNTYGIEIEFGTHDNQALSFTHIEVCYIYNTDVDNDDEKKQDKEEKEEKDGWKIETDADYTLELVSPILKFPGQEEARDFRDGLMRFLAEKVRLGIELLDLVREIRDYIQDKFLVQNKIWEYAANGNVNLQVSWITNAELQDALSWENWDEDTDLERVLAVKHLLGTNPNNNENVQAQSTIVTKSRKHGGLPSSQLNLPLPLWSFVKYEAVYKRDKAWDRLLEKNISTEDYLRKKQRGSEIYVELIMEGYADENITDPQGSNNADYVWSAKYLNKDYIESQIDEKAAIWHRYWLWLETFYVCTAIMTNSNVIDSKLYEQTINGIVDDTAYVSAETAKVRLKELKRGTNYLYRIDTGTVDINLNYLTIFKLTAGALSELSETLQKGAQEKIMALEGNMTMDQIKDAIPNNQFMQFHYALKDLTSLWFKSPLLDVIKAEGKVLGQGNQVEQFKNFFGQRSSGDIANMIISVFTANLKLLGWYYGVCEANNQGFDYEWEEFCSYNMPSIPAFGNSLLNSCTVFKQRLINEQSTKKYLATNKELPQEFVKFLKREYTAADGVPYLLIPENPKKGYIAPWEGRWDTMKKVIKPDADNKLPRYLIEHRNN